MSVADEAAGLIKGLTEVVKSQQHMQQTALQQTNDQLQTLSNTVASLTQKLPSSSAVSHSPTLHLPNLVLPVYTGHELLDRFLTQLESILKASCISTQYWLTYLKHSKLKRIAVLSTLSAKLKLQTSNFWEKIHRKPPSMSFYTCMKRVSPPSKQNEVNHGTNNCRNF